LEGALLVAITGFADEAHRRLGAAAGFDLYLAKPADPLVVEDLLRLETVRLADRRACAPPAAGGGRVPLAAPAGVPRLEAAAGGVRP
jgi:hypothetical protein